MSERQKPYQTTREEQALRYEYATADMTLAKFNQALKKLKKMGLVRRSGRIRRNFCLPRNLTSKISQIGN